MSGFYVKGRGCCNGINDFTTAFFDFFLPRICPSCGDNLTLREKIICSNCLSSCRKISVNELNADYNRQYIYHKYIEGILSLFYFEKDKAVHKIIHSVKYGKRFQTGIFLGKLFGSEFKEFLISENFNYIVPVPLHHLKKAERGYNQSEYISKGISKASGLIYKNDIIKRIRYTRSQTTLSVEERRENIKSAFKITKRKEKLIAGKNILLFDDVITTGVTIAECARILKEAGAGKVYASSIALVPPPEYTMGDFL